MLPLWRDRLALYLAPRKLALARQHRGLRAAQGQTTEVPLPEGEARDPRGMLARLALVLADPVWHDADARVVVADAWVRYAVLPYPTARLDAEGRRMHARYALTDTFGEAVADWDVTLADTAPGRPLVACAMVAGLMTGIGDALNGAGLKVVSVQPQLLVAFNAWRRRLPAEHAWFVSVDDSSLVAAHLSRGSWDRVHYARLGGDWTVELERLRALTRAGQDGAAERLYVDAPPAMRAEVQRLFGTDIEWLVDDAVDAGLGHSLTQLNRVYA